MTNKYKVITNELELLLRRMRADGKTRLPSEQELASRYSCSRQTVRASLSELVSKGLIVKKPGSGSYLADDSFINRTVYLICEDRDRYQTPALITGLRGQLAMSKYELRVFSTEGSTSSETHALELAMQEKPAAVIYEPLCDMLPNPNLRLIEKLTGAGVPVVYLNSSRVPSGCIPVAPDNTACGRALAGALIGKGYRRIACVFRMDSSAGTERYQGYLDAVTDGGLEFDDSRCLLLSYQEEKDILTGRSDALKRFADTILCGHGKCDAVICQNGMLVYALEDLLIKKGVSIPGDIAVACYDNGFYSADSPVPVTAMGYSDEFLCKKLAEAAIGLAEGRNAGNVVVPMQLL